jgi:hypothetical protein
MKKLILILALLTMGCDAPVVEGSGFWLGDENETFVNASDEATETYKKWLQAHNDEDIETILSLETDDVRIDLSDGRVISGAEAHAEGLSNYFESGDPEWNLYWAMPYKGLINGEVWIIAGQVVRNNESTVQRMIDAQFKEGKISRVIAYDKTPPPPPPAEEGSDEEVPAEE